MIVIKANERYLNINYFLLALTAVVYSSNFNFFQLNLNM